MINCISERKKVALMENSGKIKESLLELIREMAAGDMVHHSVMRMDIYRRTKRPIGEIMAEARELEEGGFIKIGRTISDYYFKPLEGK